VDFEQGVNFAIKQVREALGDRVENSLYVQTVPKRGYRFLAPVESGREPVEPTPLPNMVDPHLQKALWANIVELRLADNRRRQRQTMLTIAVGCMALVLIVLILTR
jgi:DNA-binding winged helix-turn-helix (wHTH) protein